MSERRLPLWCSVIVIVLIAAPYLFAVQMTDAGSIFGGFLINPIDGHSYLAKMQQGFRGNWRFVLPYTAEQGDGAYLFLFYLGLGHLSRILNIPLIVVFHSVRLVGALLLLDTLYLFNKRTFKEIRYQNLGFILCVFGSGLGWIAVLFGMFTSDFWVAEAYPFLSMYANPHFCIGLALMVLTLMPERKKKIFTELVLGLILGVIQPFSVVIVILIITGKLLLSSSLSLKRIFNDKEWLFTIAFAFGGGVVLIYQYWSILSDPVLSLWNAQNITTSPGFLDLLFSLSPVLILAGFGIKRGWKDDSGKMLVIWAVTSLVLMIVPWNLQRRFMTGVYIPLVGLAVYGIKDLVQSTRISFRFAAIMIIILAIPTNAIVLTSGIQAAAKQDPKIFYRGEIRSALSWILENTSADDLVLANSEIGTIIPSTTGRRVIYGHPFETVNADIEKEFLKDFFDQDQEDQFYEGSIAERDVDILFLSGGISENLERWIKSSGLELEYDNSLVRIFKIRQQ